MDSLEIVGIGFGGWENAGSHQPQGAMGNSFLRAEIRSVLSKNRVDLSLLRVGVFGNVIRLQGDLRRAAGLPDLTHEALEFLEQEIRRIPGVRRVEMLLSNWRRHDSEWKPLVTPILEMEQDSHVVPTQLSS